jgi:hypothetical protein
MQFRRRGGRKLVVAPDGSATWAPNTGQTDGALIKALANAHRWQRMPESGDYATVAELAAAEKVNPSYMSRVLRLTLLAPDIVEAVLDGRQPAGMHLDGLLRPFSPIWSAQ